MAVAAVTELVEALARLSVARSLDAVTAVIRTAARSLTGADGVTFVVRDGDDCLYYDEDAISPLWKGRRFPLDRCISGWVMRERQSAVVPDIYADPRVPHDAYRPTFVRSLAMVPVRASDPIAAIGAYWAHLHEATKDEVFTLQALAEGAALAIENARLVEDLRRAAEGERAARLEAERANAAKDEFLAVVSHELRTPLNVVQGWLWQLGRPDVTPELREKALVAIRRNVALQSRLVEELLDVSLALGGRLTLRPRPVDLLEQCRAVVGGAQPEADRKGVSLVVAGSPGVVAWADPDRLQQVVRHLVANGLKFTPAGGEVRVTVERAGAAGRVRVEDTGLGLAEDAALKVFVPFWQADSGPTRRYGGLGLGMTIVQQLVALHGGRVEARSEGVGRGLAVTVDLPARALPWGRGGEPLAAEPVPADPLPPSLPRLAGERGR